MSVNLDRVREIADAYEAACRANADEEGRDLSAEAFAAIIGAARCLAYPPAQVEGLLRAAVEDARDRVS